MGAKMFARGYSASRAEKKRQDENKENAGKKLWRFFLGDDGEEAEVHFLTEEPINFYEHTLKRGNDKYETKTCTGDGCKYCDDGDRPTYKGAYLIVDHREYEYTDQKTNKKKKGKDQVKLYVQGMKVVSQLDRISDKYGLSKRDVNIIRLGSGTQTTYTIEKGDEAKLTKKEIESLLPEKLRDEYEGDVDSLYAIIENQLMMNTDDYDPEDNEPDEEEDDDDGRDGVIGVDEDDDEEEAPKKSSKKLGGSSKKTLFKKPQNSLKPRMGAKGLMKKSKEELPFR